MKTVGIIGARGYVGGELLRLLEPHTGFDVEYVSSRKLGGEPVADHVDTYDGDLNYENVSPESAAERQADVVVLALPNGVSDAFVGPIVEANPDVVLLDVSADHRFDDAWTYGLPERFRSRVAESKRIANPGCYATGMHLGLWPLKDFFDTRPHCFGISGYSGAGTTPSPKNDPDKLRDNIMPYTLTGHTHQKEVGRHLGAPIFFTPSVASWFRGIELVISVELRDTYRLDEIRQNVEAKYHSEELVQMCHDVPLVRDNAGEHVVRIGGFSLDESNRRLAFAVTLDNLLKGAATQAVQNLNLACGYDELRGIA
jgi:N-acetyl-gamma-glutamyl-phosphate reductase